jgi:sugar phosphate isomerase/epimerase
MSIQRDRRTFLRQTTRIVTCVATGFAASMPPRSAAAIEPVARHSGARFKLSLAAYSYRDLLTGAKPKLTLDDFVDDCAKMQLHGTELTAYYFPKQITREYLCGLKQRCFRLGLGVSGTAVGNDFCHPKGPRRDQEIAAVKTWIDRAETLGAPVIRIFSGNVKPGQTAAEAHKLAVEAIEESCHYAGQHGVFLALENHGGLTATADGLLALVRDVKSSWFGVNMDTGNFHTADVYGDLARIAPYTVNVQVKVVISPAGGKKEPSDFKRLAKILTDSGYRGYIVLEFEEPGDPRVECAKHVEQLREAFG